LPFFMPCFALIFREGGRDIMALSLCFMS
jgi:hypothetical protein